MLTLHSSLLMPSPLDRLSADFKSEIGIPALLTLPCTSPEAKAYDLSGNNNVGSLNGGITTTPGGFGTLGAAWNIGAGKSIGTPFILDPGSNDFSAFVVVQYSAANGTFLSQLDGSGTGRTWLDTDGTFLRTNLTGTITTGSISIAAAGTYLFTLTKSGSSIATYVNSSPDLSFTGTVTSNNGGMVIGANKIHGLNLTGNILAAGLAMTRWVPAQVSALYACLLTGKPFPLFAPQTSAMMLGSAAAPASGKVPWPLLMGRAA